MEVDRTRARTETPGLCHCCHKPGHYVQDCPLSFDIRTMSTEEKLELLPELLALADIEGTPLSGIERATVVEEVPEEEEEGFGPRSG